MIPYNQLVEEDKQSIVKAYYEMIPFNDISKKLDVSDRAVSRVLKEEGINTRLKNRYVLNENYFETIDTEQKAYWLGFIYADGFVGDEKFNNIVIGLSEKDRQHLEIFSSHIDYTGLIRSAGKGGYEGSQDRYVINFSSFKMASDLRSIGLYPGKSLTMESIPNIPAELMRHFIRGYFDGDGSIYTVRNAKHYKGKLYEYYKPWVAIIGTTAFINELVTYLPYKHRVRPSKTDGMVYAEYGSKLGIPSIYEYLYKDATVYLQRKYDKFTNILGPSSE